MPSKILVATKELGLTDAVPHKSMVTPDGRPVNVVKCKVDGSVYVESLEAAGLSLDTVKKIQEHDSNYLANLQKEAAVAGATILNEQKDVDQVVFVAPYGADKLSGYTSRVEIQLDRSKKFVSMQTKEETFRPSISCNVVNKFQKAGDKLKNELKDILQDRLAAN